MGSRKYLNKKGIENRGCRGMSSRMGIVGVHPGTFRKSGKQRTCRIRNLEEGTEDGRCRISRMGEDRQSRREGTERTGGVGLRGSAKSGAKDHNT